jgi:hypothetical protein
MRVRSRQTAALALAAAMAVPVAGCGGGKKGQPISRAEASQIIARLQEAERRNDPLRCNDLQRDTIPALRTLVDNLPAGTDSDVKQTVSDGIDHLNDLVSQECNQQKVPTESTPTQPSVPTTTTPTESTPSTDTSTNTNTDTNTTPSNTNTNTNTTPSNTTPAPGGTPGPTDTNGGGN